MSAALASAKKKRSPAAVQPAPPSLQPQNMAQGNPNMSGGLTLPQVIQLVDRRLIVLEKFMADSRATVQASGEQPQTYSEEGQLEEQVIPDNISEVLSEFDKRYEMLAEEIINIKNIVLSLQTYTMDVNKMLLEERVRILSDIDETMGEPSENQ
jgi:hypothetical protein